MMIENETEPSQVCLPPDGYGQWNTEPPATYASWGDYFASVSQQASEMYRQDGTAFSDKIN